MFRNRATGSYWTVMFNVPRRAAIFKCLVGGLLIAFAALYHSDIHVSTSTAGRSIVSKVQFALSPAKPCISYRYEDPSGRNVATRPFGVNCSLLSKIGFPIEDFSHVSIGKPDSFVFTTAANDRYFHIAMDAIARVQTFFPKVTIYFWDLSENLKAEHVQKLSWLCNVKYRKFNYAPYPKFVRELKTYSWKVIVLHEMLREHPNVIWIDSSIRLQKGDFEQSLDQASNSRGVLMFLSSNIAVFATTYQTMYEYLPIDMKYSTRIPTLGTGCFYIQLSEQLYKHVIRWWLLCAVDEKCIAPTRDLNCDFNQGEAANYHTRYANCHRYEQSAINILLANYFDYDDRLYQSGALKVTVERYSQDRETPKVCLMNGSTLAVKSKEYFV